MHFRVTAAGRAALVDPDNVGTRQVRITRVLVGSGFGPGGAADDARTALRNQRDSAVASAATGAAARIAVRGDVLASAAYNVTEVGLEAVIGDGAPFLFAYWTDDTPTILAAAATGVTVLVVATLDLVSDVPAALAIAAAPAVTVAGASAFGALSDVPDGLVAESYYRGNAAGTEFEALDRAAVLSDLLAGLDGGDYLRVAEAGGVRSLEGLTTDELAAALRV